MGVLISTGIVVGRKVSDNRDGDHDRLLLSVQISSSGDVQTVEWMGPSGDDSSPVDGARVLILAVGQAWKIAFSADDLIDPTSVAGERKIYASADGVIKSSVAVRVSGDVVLNDGADFAVQFTAMKAAFDQLVADFDAHVHGGVESGGSSTSAPTASTADMSGAKIEKVRLP